MLDHQFWYILDILRVNEVKLLCLILFMIYISNSNEVSLNDTKVVNEVYLFILEARKVTIKKSFSMAS